MNKKFLFISSPIISFFLLFVCILTAAFLYYYFNSQNKDFVLYKEEGSVYYKKPSSDTYEELTSNEIELTSGSSIKTEEAYAHIILSDNSLMSIDRNTEIIINVERKTTKIENLVGNTWHRLKRVFNQEEYTVETSTTVATVRGTKFGVMASSDYSSMYTVEGEMEIGIITENEEYKDLQNLVVGKYALHYSAEEEFYVQDTPEEIKNTTWYQRNLLIDEKFDHHKPYDIMQTLDSTLNLLGVTYTPPDIHKIEDDTGTDTTDETTSSTSTSTTSSTTVETTTTTTLPQEQPDPPKDETPTDFQELSSLLKTKYNINVIKKEHCTNVGTDEFAQDIELYMSYQNQFTAQDEAFASYLYTLESYCQDNELDPYEIEDLQWIYQEVTADAG